MCEKNTKFTVQQHNTMYIASLSDVIGVYYVYEHKRHK